LNAYPLEARNALERNRDIQVFIKGCAITIQVKDPTQEWDLRLQARIKDEALGKHLGIKPLLHESMLMDLGCKESSQVPEELVAPMQAARQCASDILSGVELECFADIQKAHGQYKNHQDTHTQFLIRNNVFTTSVSQRPIPISDHVAQLGVHNL
jgi:hypothetical protein